MILTLLIKFRKLLSLPLSLSLSWMFIDIIVYIYIYIYKQFMSSCFLQWKLLLDCRIQKSQQFLCYNDLHNVSEDCMCDYSCTNLVYIFLCGVIKGERNIIFLLHVTLIHTRGPFVSSHSCFGLLNWIGIWFSVVYVSWLEQHHPHQGGRILVIASLDRADSSVF